jgi:ferritin
MQDGFNGQITAEFYSAHLYLAMSAYLDNSDLPGFANWMRIQYQEEISHAMKMFDYLMERDGRAILSAIDTPPADFGSPLEVMEAVYAHEQEVTGLINNLLDLAMKENDHASNIFLQWFVNEQVEEEATAKGIVQQLKLLADSKVGLFQMDRELGQRVFVAPAEN